MVPLSTAGSIRGDVGVECAHATYNTTTERSTSPPRIFANAASMSSSPIL